MGQGEKMGARLETTGGGQGVLLCGAEGGLLCDVG